MLLNVTILKPGPRHVRYPAAFLDPPPLDSPLNMKIHSFSSSIHHPPPCPQ